MRRLIILCLLSLSPGLLANENTKALALFEQIFQQSLDRSPIFQTSIGVKSNYGEWDNMSEGFAQQGQRLRKVQLSKLKGLDRGKLSEENLLSLRLLEYKIEEEVSFFPWRHHYYVFNQMYGMHTSVVSLLMNEHRVESVADAEAYISRLRNVTQLMDQLIEAQEHSAKIGVAPPKFVIEKVISSSKNIIARAPFDKGNKDDSTLFADIKGKISKLEIAQKEKSRLVQSAEKALQDHFAPAYKKLIASLEHLHKTASNEVGAWRFPDGKAFYAAALKRTTTTDLEANEIHKLGLKEVARIHGEMREIMKKVEFKGSLQEFFTFIRTDNRFYFADTEDGRNEYLDEAVSLVKEIKGRLPEIFSNEAKTALLVKRVEAYREKSAGMAFYQAGTPDGSRPGIFYANLSNMKEIPIYEMAALVYHEGLPGHHMQISIARELQNIPSFRKYGGHTAYIEGWGLYSELLPKEMGLYQDPYSDFGRLALELWRACRLVVDTGIHELKWSREQTINYLMENTPAARARVERSVDRYIVIPSQATAYKIGMLKILQLRAYAKEKLGDKFDIREFHQQILASGSLPLSILEERIHTWVGSL